MNYNRRSLLRLTGIAAAGGATGCISGDGSGNDGQENDGNEGRDGEPEETGMSNDEGREDATEANPELGAASSLNLLRSRVYDPIALGRAGATDAGAEEASRIFAYFEEAGGEYGVHEFVEETDHDAYEGFEDSLGALRTALEDGDVETAVEKAGEADDHLASAQSEVVDEGASDAFDTMVLASRLFDAHHADATGGVPGEVGTAVFSEFETAEVHDAVEEADHDAYEGFEEAMGDIANGDPGRAGDAFGSATDAAYALSEDAADAAYLSSLVARGYDARLVAENNGDGGSVARNALADWEEARAHEALEEEDHGTYEGFEEAFEDYVSSVTDDGALEGFDEAATRARFALAGALEEAPTGEEGHDHEKDEHGDEELSGGPNVHEGEPEADHLIDMQAVAFEPEQLTVTVGDTVAWVHKGGEPHNVVAYGDGIPEDAEYWASGGFSSEEETREGWENGKGAVQSGEYYERDFETPGTHEYFCVPHEAAGMVGEVVVEE